MIKTLRISFSLKNAYRVNSILYGIRQIPLVKRIIPDTVYQIVGFKILANVLSLLWEILMAFLGKFLYFLVIAGTTAFYGLTPEGEGTLLLHILLFLTVIGAVVNTYMFNPTKDKYYGVILLGMNAKEYALVNYAYAILKVLVGFGIFGMIFGRQMGIVPWQCLLIPLFAAGTKTVAVAYSLRDYEKRGKIQNENHLGKLLWVGIGILLAAAYALPAAGYMVPMAVSLTVMALGAALGILSIRRLLVFGNYRAMYQEMLSEGLAVQLDKDTQVKLQQEVSLKSISTDKKISSSRRGFAYLNELFIKRHRKILWRASLRISAVALAVTVALLLAFQFAPQTKEPVNGFMMNSLPYSVFIMYLINRGTGFTRALFVNCDHSLLTYSFYKKPKFILRLFWIRLGEIVKVNLLPAAVIGAGLMILLYASGGTDQPVDYGVLLVSNLCLSVFFSVHYLMLYYLLQPYNAGTEIKSGSYQVIVWLTYFVCYLMMQVRMPTLIFGFLTIGFCVLYCIVASILVYRLAPRTFRIRA